MNYSIVILAAGQGTRMRSDIPKVLHKLCGKPMIYHIIKESKKVTDDITVVLFHQSKRIEEYIHSHFSDVDIIIQDHKNYPGTGGAVMGISPKKRRVVVLNGDMPLVEAKDIKKLGSSRADIAITAIELENISGYGRVITDNKEVIKIVEEKDATKEEKAVKLGNAGVYSFDREFFLEGVKELNNNNAQKEYYITDLVSIAKTKKKSVEAVIGQKNSFMGINSKLHLSQLETIMQKRINEAHMINGVILRLPETITIEEGVKFIGECEVESGVVIKGETTIENSTIFANSVIEDSIIKNSTVGPMARIRPNTQLKNSHIGNFVEIKKSTLNGVKAGHLSYIGDTTIGDRTNIGAGTITCNYDGKKKYQTKIGKNVFIGSDSQLIAPVEIEDNTIIAAGSTITNNVKSGSLAISRSKQKNIAGFFKKFFG